MSHTEVKVVPGYKWRMYLIALIAAGLLYFYLGYLPTILWVLLIVVAIVLLVNLIQGQSNEPVVLDRSAPSWPLHTLILMGALLTFVVGWWVNRKKIEEVTFEKSGPVTTYRTRHTLYSIPMQYWGLIGLAIYFGFTAYRSFR